MEKNKQYIGSQQHWEDSINDDYDQSEQHNREQVDDREQPDNREITEEELILKIVQNWGNAMADMNTMIRWVKEYAAQFKQEDILPRLNQSTENLSKIEDKDKWLHEVRGEEPWEDLAYKELPITMQDGAVKAFLIWMNQNHFSITRKLNHN